MWACLGKCVHYINVIATVFTWLNAAAHLYKLQPEPTTWGDLPQQTRFQPSLQLFASKQ